MRKPVLVSLTQRLTRRRWIELYGISAYKEMLRIGYWAVPCVNCADSICHGWKLERIA